MSETVFRTQDALARMTRSYFALLSPDRMEFAAVVCMYYLRTLQPLSGNLSLGNI